MPFAALLTISTHCPRLPHISQLIFFSPICYHAICYNKHILDWIVVGLFTVCIAGIFFPVYLLSSLEKNSFYNRIRHFFRGLYSRLIPEIHWNILFVLAESTFSVHHWNILFALAETWQDVLLLSEST